MKTAEQLRRFQDEYSSEFREFAHKILEPILSRQEDTRDAIRDLGIEGIDIERALADHLGFEKSELFEKDKNEDSSEVSDLLSTIKNRLQEFLVDHKNKVSISRSKAEELAKKADIHESPDADDLAEQAIREAFAGEPEEVIQQELDAHRDAIAAKLRPILAERMRKHVEGVKKAEARGEELAKKADIHESPDADDLAEQAIREAFAGEPEEVIQQELDAHRDAIAAKLRPILAERMRKHVEGVKKAEARGEELAKKADIHESPDADDLAEQAIREAFAGEPEEVIQQELDAHRDAIAAKLRPILAERMRKHVEGVKKAEARGEELAKKADIHESPDADDLAEQAIREAFAGEPEEVIQQELDAHRDAIAAKLRPILAERMRLHEQHLHKIGNTILTWSQTADLDIEKIKSPDDLLNAYLQSNPSDTTDIERNWDKRFQKIFQQAYKDVERKRKEESDRKLAEAKNASREELVLSKQDLDNEAFKDPQTFERAMRGRVAHLLDDLPQDRKKEFTDYVQLLITNFHKEWLAEHERNTERKLKELIGVIDGRLDAIDDQELFLLAANQSDFHAHMLRGVSDILGRHDGVLGAALENHFQKRSAQIYTKHRKVYEQAIDRSQGEIEHLSLDDRDLKENFTEQSFGAYIRGKLQSLSLFKEHVPPELERIMERKIDSLFREYQEKKTKEEKESPTNEAEIKKAIDTALVLSEADMKAMPLQRKQFDEALLRKTQDALRKLFPDGRIPDQFQRSIAEGTAKAWEKHFTSAVNTAQKDIQSSLAIPPEQHLKDAKTFTAWLQTQLPSLARFPAGEPLPRGLEQAVEAKCNRYKEAFKDTAKMAETAVRKWRPPEGIVDYAQFKTLFLTALGNEDIAKKHAAPIEALLLQKWALYQAGAKKNAPKPDEDLQQIKGKGKPEELVIKNEELQPQEAALAPAEKTAMDIMKEKKERLQLFAGKDWKQLQMQLRLDEKQSERMVNRFSVLMRSEGMQRLLLEGDRARHFGPFILGLCARLNGSQFMDLMQELKTEKDIDRIPLILLHNSGRQAHIMQLCSTQPELWEQFTRGLHLVELEEDQVFDEKTRAQLLTEGRVIDMEEDTEHELVEKRIDGKEIGMYFDEEKYPEGSERLWEMLGGSFSLQQMIQEREAHFIPFLTAYFDALTPQQFEACELMLMHGKMEPEHILEMFFADPDMHRKAMHLQAVSPSLWHEFQKGIDKLDVEEDFVETVIEGQEQPIEVPVDAAEDVDTPHLKEEQPAEQTIGVEMSAEGTEDALQPQEQPVDVAMEESVESVGEQETETVVATETIEVPDATIAQQEQPLEEPAPILEATAEENGEAFIQATPNPQDANQEIPVVLQQESEDSTGETVEAPVAMVNDVPDVISTPMETMLQEEQQKTIAVEAEQGSDIVDPPVIADQQIVSTDESVEESAVQAENVELQTDASAPIVETASLEQEEVPVPVEALTDTGGEDAAKEIGTPLEDQADGVPVVIEKNGEQPSDLEVSEASPIAAITEMPEAASVEVVESAEIAETPAEQVQQPIEAIAEESEQPVASAEEAVAIEVHETTSTPAETIELALEGTRVLQEQENIVTKNQEVPLIDKEEQQPVVNAGSAEMEMGNQSEAIAPDEPREQNINMEVASEKEAVIVAEETDQNSIPEDVTEEPLTTIEDKERPVVFEMRENPGVEEIKEKRETPPREVPLAPQAAAMEATLAENVIPLPKEEPQLEKFKETVVVKAETIDRKEVFLERETDVAPSPVEFLRLYQRDVTVSFMAQHIDVLEKPVIGEHSEEKENDTERLANKNVSEKERMDVIEEIKEHHASQYFSTTLAMARRRGPEQKESERHMGALSLRTVLSRFSSVAQIRFPDLEVKIDVDSHHLESGVSNHFQLSEDISNFWFDCFTNTKIIRNVTFSTSSRRKNQKVINLTMDVQGEKEPATMSFVCMLEREEKLSAKKEMPVSPKHSTKAATHPTAKRPSKAKVVAA